MKPRPVLEQRVGTRSAQNGGVLDVPAPRGLQASTFSLKDDEYAVLSFPLPELRIPRGLSRAEEDVVRAVLEGQSNAQIARARGTSSNTVANQLRSIYAKLGISGRVDLVGRCFSKRPAR
jgi:DNA-binding CsgD family transcriptional regulator